MSADPQRPRGREVSAAWDLAEGMLSGPLPRRWLHSQGVCRQADINQGQLQPIDGEILVQAAVLHDVGYAPDVAITGFHPLDGARYLKSIGVDDRVVGLVAHHSCARVEAAERGLGPDLAEFELGPAQLTEFLIFCDMTTSPDGVTVSVDERLAEILDRYGPYSVVGRSITSAEPELRAATYRVARRLAVRIRPAPDLQI